MEIPECFYRISVKALVLNETRDKFLITKEASGEWEIPGGGLDWGEDYKTALQRELAEEMGVQATWIADNPSYFISGPMRKNRGWAANILFETKLENLDFTPSDECVAIDWINKDNQSEFDLFPNVPKLLELFDLKRHQS